MIKCLSNASQILTLKTAHDKNGRLLQPQDTDIINKASIIYNDSEILWVGTHKEIPSSFAIESTIDCSNKCIVPEIVDSHTHLVFGGNRAKEYTMRLNGADYEEIAKAGGGILNTMNSTKSASEEELFTSAVDRIERIYSLGVGTIEIKSGYGLTFESEKKITKVIAKLKSHFHGRVNILNTYLAAHAVPKEFKNSKDYLEQVVLPLLEELASEGLVDFVDIFHEQGYFDLQDTKALFNKAKELNLKIKIHADEFNDNKGAVTACEFDAISADHLLCTGADGIEALSKSKTVATLLPGTALFLSKPMAKARQFLDSGCRVAIASDYNPGSCHCDNVLLISSLCAKKLELNITELWSSITLNSAHALDLKSQGAIVKGLKPRFSFFNCESIDEITYTWGKNLAVNINY